MGDFEDRMLREHKEKAQYVYLVRAVKQPLTGDVALYLIGDKDVIDVQNGGEFYSITTLVPIEGFEQS